MNELRPLRTRCFAAAGRAKCELDEPALLTASQPGTVTREAAVFAKLAGPEKKDSAQRSVSDKATRRGQRKRKPAGPPPGRGGNVCEDVPSVAELTVTICSGPDSRKKRIKLAEALRERGLDESKVAAMYSGIAEKLSRNKESGAVGVAAAKLLFDVLKELADWLEPEKIAGKSEAGETPQFVRLIHNVPRPVRTE